MNKETHTTYEQTVRRLFPRVDLATDKRPENFRYLGLIKRIFPSAKIIHTKRNPLDNILSIYFLRLEPSMAYASNLLDIAHHYREHSRLMMHWRKLYPNDIFEFDYDAFVREPLATAQGLTDFLGLDWQDECLAFHPQQPSQNGQRVASARATL